MVNLGQEQNMDSPLVSSTSDSLAVGDENSICVKSETAEMENESDKTANSPIQSGSATDSGVEVTSPSTQSPDSARSSPQGLAHTDTSGSQGEASSLSLGRYPGLLSQTPELGPEYLSDPAVTEFTRSPGMNSITNDSKHLHQSPSAADKTVLVAVVKSLDAKENKSSSDDVLPQSSPSVANASKEDISREKETFQEVAVSAEHEVEARVLPVSQSKPASPQTINNSASTAVVSPSTSAEDEESMGAVGGVKSPNSSSSPNHHGEVSSTYYVKWIAFNKTRVPIITQNENGPCPLIAIMNVLLLKGKLQLASLVEMVTSKQLMDQLGEYVLSNTPKNLDAAHLANYEQNVQDAISLMHKLQTGLDVNVRFTGVSDFEYTSECIIFDLLEIGLYHGWLVDPQDSPSVEAVGKYSYNQLVERIIQNKHLNQDELVREALIAEQFLDRTASQLTYHGLCELCSTVKDQELCVFFRNNHFGTLYKHNNELFLLVTDQGFLTESNAVWETLSNVDGDCHFVDGCFCTYTKPQPSVDPIPESPYSTGDEQINSDYQVALSLQHHDQQMIAEQEAAWGQFHTEFGAASTSDHELALRLQEEENRHSATPVNQQRQQQGQGQGQALSSGSAVRPREDRRDRKEGKDCCIL